MAGALTISTLNNDTGVLATQNGMTGIAKAWGNFNGSSGTVNDSFNISSVTRNATGDYTVNLTTAMPNTNYSVVGSARTNNSFSVQIVVPWWSTSGNVVVAPTTSAFRISSAQSSGAGVDSIRIFFAVYSS